MLRRSSVVGSSAIAVIRVALAERYGNWLRVARARFDMGIPRAVNWGSGFSVIDNWDSGFSTVSLVAIAVSRVGVVADGGASHASFVRWPNGVVGGVVMVVMMFLSLKTRDTSGTGDAKLCRISISRVLVVVSLPERLLRFPGSIIVVGRR